MAELANSSCLPLWLITELFICIPPPSQLQLSILSIPYVLPAAAQLQAQQMLSLLFPRGKMDERTKRLIQTRRKLCTVASWNSTWGYSWDFLPSTWLSCAEEDHREVRSRYRHRLLSSSHKATRQDRIIGEIRMAYNTTFRSSGMLSPSQ